MALDPETGFAAATAALNVGGAAGGIAAFEDDIWFRGGRDLRPPGVGEGAEIGGGTDTALFGAEDGPAPAADVGRAEADASLRGGPEGGGVGSADAEDLQGPLPFMVIVCGCCSPTSTAL